MTQIMVGPVLLERCRKKAESAANNNMTKNYIEKYSKSSPDIGRNIEIMRIAFVAEGAVCIFIGLDPEKALTWKTDTPDIGYDLTVRGKTIDIKTSDHPGARRLMWPIKKIDKLPHAADIFIFSRVLPAARSNLGQSVDLVGWVTKERFIKEKTVAHGMYGLVDGTPFLSENSLDDMRALREYLI